MQSSFSATPWAYHSSFCRDELREESLDSNPPLSKPLLINPQRLGDVERRLMQPVQEETLTMERFLLGMPVTPDPQSVNVLSSKTSLSGVLPSGLSSTSRLHG